MPLSAPPALFSAETFEEAARAVSWAWEKAQEAEEAQAGSERRAWAVSWRWVPSASRFAGSHGGGYLEALSRVDVTAALLPGVTMPLVGGEEVEDQEEDEDEKEEEEEEDEADAATLPRRGRRDGEEGEDGGAPAACRVELHICFGASYRAPLMLVRVARAETAAEAGAAGSPLSLEALERSLAAAASAGTSAAGGGAPCPAGPLAPCEHPLLSGGSGGVGGWAALHACASAAAVAEMMTATEEEEEEGGSVGRGREGETHLPPRVSNPPSPRSAAAALAAWMSLACPAVGVRPPLGLWRRVREGEREKTL